MEENEIERGNIAIANFMGYKVTEDGWVLTGEYPNMAEMMFHASWDWLMPVVEKIEAMEAMDGKRIITKWVHILGKGCIIEIDNMKDLEIIVCHTHDSPMTKLEAVYSAVLQFITYHNNLNHG